MRVLIIEDHKTLAHELSQQLQRGGFLSDCASSLSEARRLMDDHDYGLALIDRRLPDGDGVSLLSVLRRAQPEARIVVLTALDRKSDVVASLEAGADDYITKPFDPNELMARIRASLRRTSKNCLPPFTVGRLSFSPQTRALTAGEEPVLLQRLELALLESLMLRAGRVVTRRKLVTEVWGDEQDLSLQNLKGLVSQLRGRLKSLNAGAEILSSRGLGYMLRELKE